MKRLLLLSMVLPVLACAAPTEPGAPEPPAINCEPRVWFTLVFTDGFRSRSFFGYPPILCADSSRWRAEYLARPGITPPDSISFRPLPL